MLQFKKLPKKPLVSYRHFLCVGIVTEYVKNGSKVTETRSHRGHTSVDLHCPCIRSTMML